MLSTFNYINVPYYNYAVDKMSYYMGYKQKFTRTYRSLFTF